MEIKTTTTTKSFTGYDLVVAQCHLENWGIVYLDEYDKPLEVEEVMYMLEEM